MYHATHKEHLPFDSEKETYWKQQECDNVEIPACHDHHGSQSCKQHIERVKHKLNNTSCCISRRHYRLYNVVDKAHNVKKKVLVLVVVRGKGGGNKEDVK